MNRKDFFKKLGLGAVAIATTPTILAQIKPKQKFKGFTEKTTVRFIAHDMIGKDFWTSQVYEGDVLLADSGGIFYVLEVNYLWIKIINMDTDTFKNNDHFMRIGTRRQEL